MQELRSTDILDKEIKADAVQKADAILKRADFECQQILKSVDSKIENAKLEKKEFYENRLNKVVGDIEASLPLEKQRFEVSFVQKKLVEAINAYLKSLSKEKFFDLVSKDFDFSVNSSFNAYVYGFDLKDAKSFLSKKLGKKLLSCEKTEFCKTVAEDDLGFENNMGIILEADDKALRCRLTLSQVFSCILDKYRIELTNALFANGGAK